MKQLFLVMVVFIITPVLFGQTNANMIRTFYIVRHAEKDTGSNPAISLIGRKRAGDLYRKLRHKKIDLIFVSQFRRTGMTADSLRLYKNIDTLHYLADTSADLLFQKINSLTTKPKNILIIGHSNTLPAIIRKAGIQGFMLKEIPDDEYDHLFVVKKRKNRAVLKSKKYGEYSLPASKALSMKLLQ
jgi:phosphohistidine phosphatase SixA